jgi:hypothetical protein
MMSYTAHWKPIPDINNSNRGELRLALVGLRSPGGEHMITPVTLIPLERSAASGSPSSPPDLPPAFVCRILLNDLYAAVLEYHNHRRPVPPLELFQATIIDALNSTDQGYISLIYSLFSVEIENFLRGNHFEYHL